MWHSMIGGGLVTQLCPALCDPMDYSLQHSSVQGIFQTRILEGVAISFFRETSWSKNWTQLSCIAGSLIRCRWILYQLSHQGSPILWLTSFIQHKSFQGLCCSTYQYFILFYCQVIFHCMDIVLCCVSHSVVSNSLQPHDCYLPGSSVHGIFQARIPEQVAISYSRGYSLSRDLICVFLYMKMVEEPASSSIIFWYKKNPVSSALTGEFFTT